MYVGGGSGIRIRERVLGLRFEYHVNILVQDLHPQTRDFNPEHILHETLTGATLTPEKMLGVFYLFLERTFDDFRQEKNV
jgi:hypothetical protein